jgi:CMP-N-acetylneuraminic acid synthetase
MIAWPLRAVKDSGIVDALIVSGDDYEIAS